MSPIQDNPLDDHRNRLGLGSVTLADLDRPSAFRLLDEWVGLGGRLLDTAAIYGAGRSEEVIGAWLSESRRRDDVVILTKGGHPSDDGRSRLDAGAIKADLGRSLSALKVDEIDIYMLHRDDVKIPVENFIDLLNEGIAAGRVRTIGASNWTVDRVDDANAYAHQHDLVGFTSLSNCFGLARPSRPLISGAVSATDPASRRWLEESRVKLVAWSAMSGGYFAARADDPWADSMRAYDSPANHERRRRVGELALEKNISATQLVLAWVLGQPFAPVALVGARTGRHLHAAWQSIDIVLTATEMAWLDAVEPLDER